MGKILEIVINILGILKTFDVEVRMVDDKIKFTLIVDPKEFIKKPTDS